MYIIPATCSAQPLPTPPKTFLISDVTKAVTRVDELTTRHPSWPGCRVRAAVARELNISTVQLRYLLRQGAK
jgi:hypothetical protein